MAYLGTSVAQLTGKRNSRNFIMLYGIARLTLSVSSVSAKNMSAHLTEPPHSEVTW